MSRITLSDVPHPPPTPPVDVPDPDLPPEVEEPPMPIPVPPFDEPPPMHAISDANDR